MTQIVSDMVRRTQAVCFSPLALFNGWATSTKLWTYPEATPHVRAAIVLRQRLLPYLYHSFAQYHHEGTPVIRPMQLVKMTAFASDGPGMTAVLDATANPYEIPESAREIKNQFLFGDSLLVAPIAPNQASRTVVLPAGRWYDFHTGAYAGENEVITVEPALGEVPLFVRDGALIPMLVGERDHAPRMGERVALEIRHYGEQPGSLAFYDDDGETFAYERGDFSWTTLSTAKDASGRWQGSVTPDTNGRAWTYTEVSWTFMTK
jgi:alpha-D-xyloside xylohydrolase